LWGIDWSACFPSELTPGISVHVGPSDTVSQFLGEHFVSIFGEGSSAGFWQEAGSAKERYLRHACDGFVVRDRGVDVGVVIFNPVDWSTYYLRMMAFLPHYQGRELGPMVVARVAEVLAPVGVERFELETAPSNTRALNAAFAAGFVMTGNTMSERWGALCRLTRFLNVGAEQSYLDRYCLGGRKHRRARGKRLSLAPVASYERLQKEGGIL
jgi:GNAT superfamily N-acetyltransferase